MKKAYITRAILKDYLTIKNVDITFNEGINIIIGKNGTGKTNFINYLADGLSYTQKIANNNSLIYFKLFKSDYQKEIKNTRLLKQTRNEESLAPLFEVREKKNVVLKNKSGEVIDEIDYLGALDAVKIGHGIPEHYQIAQEPFNSVLKRFSDGYTLSPNSEKDTLGFEIGKYYVSNYLFFPTESFDINDSLKSINSYVYRYSNIEKVRIGKNFNLNENDPNEIHFNNLYLEFFVNDSWLLFNQLSDGTKRLFYIISEITLSTQSIILLEEPELGIHPHQLYTLMQFIKEMSEKFQFIITTHSPTVLNTLSSDELVNIIISSIENGATKLRHLDEEQISKAQAYMKEMDLSDYWIHSDLED